MSFLTFLKRDYNTGVSCGYCEVFKNSFSIKHLWWLLLTVLPHYSQLGYLFFDFAPMCFRFWSKTYTKRCKNNSLLSRDKTISSLLELIDHVLSISECFGNTCFLFSWKTYTKRCTNNYVISCVKRLSSPALCSGSSAFNFRIWFGKRKSVV